MASHENRLEGEARIRVIGMWEIQVSFIRRGVDYVDNYFTVSQKSFWLKL
jgi:hypothetical protein